MNCKKNHHRFGEPICRELETNDRRETEKGKETKQLSLSAVTVSAEMDRQRRQPGSEDYANANPENILMTLLRRTSVSCCLLQSGEYPNRDTTCVNHVICVSPASEQNYTKLSRPDSMMESSIVVKLDEAQQIKP